MIKIYNGDCFDFLKTIADNSIDCTVTSPPYNKGGLSDGNRKCEVWSRGDIKYDSISDALDEEEYICQQKILLDELYRVTKDGGSVFYNHKVRRAGGDAHFPKWALESKFNLHQIIIWDRRAAPDVNNTHLLPTTELMFWLSKGMPKCHRDRIIHTSEIWRIAPSVTPDHPATFPIELPDTCIKLTTDVGDAVLDPYLGLGTSGVAAVQNHCNFYGSELSLNYFEKAKHNIDIAQEQSTFCKKDFLDI